LLLACFLVAAWLLAGSWLASGLLLACFLVAAWFLAGSWLAPGLLSGCSLVPGLLLACFLVAPWFLACSWLAFWLLAGSWLAFWLLPGCWLAPGCSSLVAGLVPRSLLVSGSFLLKISIFAQYSNAVLFSPVLKHQNA
jgi:hypothetical protein